MTAALRKWYFAINQQGFESCRPLLTVAIGSCRANTDLQPICLYNGDHPGHMADLRKMGATVLPHQSSLAPVLRAGYGAQFDKFSGHWLRVDIPLIETEDDFVLYSDIDVMFLGPPAANLTPRYLAAAPERYRWRWPHFNSGVMVLNLPGLRAVHDRFVAAITRRMAPGWQPPGHDQVSYNQFFRWRHARLPLSMNWKPYWGVNPDARLVHFHGPKPAHADAFQSGTAPEAWSGYKRLYALNPDAYAHYAGLAARYGRD